VVSTEQKQQVSKAQSELHEMLQSDDFADCFYRALELCDADEKVRPLILAASVHGPPSCFSCRPEDFICRAVFMILFPLAPLKAFKMFMQWLILRLSWFL
jgi:hypothetical protein